MHNIDKVNNPRLCKKITNQHLYLDNFSKQSVKLASQVLSRSMSSALYFCVSQGIMSQSSVFTAEFVEKFDIIFDCLNSTVAQNSMKPYRIQLIKDNLPFNYLKDSRKFISDLKLIDKKNSKSVKDSPFKNGFLISINSLLELCIELSETEIKCLKTRNLNQDIAEHSFSIMREKSGCSYSLTYKQFKSSFRVLLVHDMCSASERFNCSWDSDCLLTYISHNEKSDKVEFTSSGIEHNSIQDSAIPINEILNLDNSLVQNTHTYITGFIVSTMKNKYKCDICSNNLIQNDYSFRNDTIFLEYKSYNELQNTHLFPSEIAAECISRMISLIRAQLKTTQQKIGIKIKLNERVFHDLNFEWIPECHRELLKQNIFDLLFSILIHFHIKILNRKMKIPQKLKKKKIEKFSHWLFNFRLNNLKCFTSYDKLM